VVKDYPDVFNEIYYQDIFNLTVSECNCGAGWKAFSITAEGDIRSCSILGKNGYIGNILKQSIHEILEQPVCKFYSNFSKQWNEKACLDCTYKDYCARCLTRIYATNIQRVKDGLNLCEIAKRNKMNEYLDFNSNFTYLITTE
jgi:radical SAM protein with 4Fe4S-binding SPASM domain